MIRWLAGEWRFQMGGASLVAAAILVALAGWGAVRKRPVPPATAIRAVRTLAPGRLPQPDYSLQRVMATVDKDPFHPARRRPGKRFQLPEDRVATSARQPAGGPTSVRLIGTAVNAEGGGFAMCALEGGTPRIVRVGEHVGGWTLTKVTPGAAEFATPTGSVTVRVPKPGQGS